MFRFSRRNDLRCVPLIYRIVYRCVWWRLVVRTLGHLRPMQGLSILIVALRSGELDLCIIVVSMP